MAQEGKHTAGHLHIRERERTTASPKVGQRQAWTEYQVMRGNKILSRHETMPQAERATAKAEGRSDA